MIQKDKMKNQNKALKMAKYAYQNVPLYYNYAEKLGKNIEQAVFEEIPVVDKSFFIEKGMSLLSTRYISKYLQGKLIYSRTSGSTGKCTEVFWEEQEEIKSMLSLWLYRKKYYGILPSDKLCYFYPADNGSLECFEEKNRLALSKMLIIEEKFDAIIEKIEEFQPIWLILQPGIACVLCEYIEKTKRKVPDSIRYVEFTGEYLEEPVRKKVIEVFRCKTANQYGSKEVNSIAYECPEGNLHIMEDNVFVEIQGEDQEGEICLTTLQNKAMPLVRFNNEDRGQILHHVNCPCGNRNAVLKLLAGRSNDWILREDGTKVHAYFFIQMIQKINLQMDGAILQFQIIQKDWKSFDFYLVIEDEQDKRDIADILLDKVLAAMGDDTEIQIQYYDKPLPEKKTGKLACFRNVMQL